MKAYVFQAALLCEDCGGKLAETLPYNEDSDHFPNGPWPEGGGEADCPQHCDHCQAFLDNPLTGDGETYVRDAFREYVETGRGSLDTLAEWKSAYDWVWSDFESITVESMEEEGLSRQAKQRLAALAVS